MKDFLIGLGIATLIGLGTFLITQPENEPQTRLGAGSYNFFYNSASQATTSVTTSSWSVVLAADSSRGYTTLCNNSNVANDAMFLGFGATSTKPYGFRLASGACYEMTLDKMFYGNVYAIASGSASTMLRVTGSY